jgi:hypothetical protein
MVLRPRAIFFDAPFLPIGWLWGSRQIDMKRRALAQFGFDFDISTVALDNPIHRREPQICSTAQFFSCEKGIENSGLDVPAHTFAGI